MQTDEKTKGTVGPVAQPTDITGIACHGERTETSRPRFNKFIYENLRGNLEGHVEAWSRMAVRNPSPEITHALWLKAEGLGYALRLIYAFEPEFRELVESASRGAEPTVHARQQEDLERKSS
ncbi:MAG: hypothetical protein M1404_05365 [Acidobacteria bacterium]|nr:hypothetical protein [Acidobacteriota bacterium]